MARFEEFFKKWARDRGVKIAEEVKAEAIRLSTSKRYPPASRPGTPPAMRTGRFARSIKIVRTTNGARLVFWAPYSKFLLLGTRKMAPRPVHEIALANVLKRRKGKR
jgi:hypothetical protein